MKKMTLKMAARKLGCSVQWVRDRVKSAGIECERMNDRSGTILIAEGDLAKLAPPKRKFFKKRSVGRQRPANGGPVQESIFDAEGRFDMRKAVVAAIAGVVKHGWKPMSDRDRKVADAMFEYLAS